MDDFDKVMIDVRNAFTLLLASEVYNMGLVPQNIPKKGIYLFSEHGKALYVGRTNNLRKRLQYHTRNNHNQATLAFLLARRETGKTNASYQKKGSRSDLLDDPVFRLAFDKARARIRRMDLEFIEEENAIKQALLEIYTAFQVKAEYNDFENH